MSRSARSIYPRRFPCCGPIRYPLVALVGLAILASGSACFGQNVGAQLLLDLSGGTFDGIAYTQIARAPGRPNDLFISRQDGNIYRFDLTTKTQSPFFSIPNTEANDEIDTGQYWGLLGFTFAPDFATSGDLYVHVADDRQNPDMLPAPYHHRIYIRRYSLTDPLSNTPTAGPSTNILRWAQPLADHSGGWMGFHPDDPDTLWITSGDGGNNDGNRDTLRTGQNPRDLLSGILRINVAGTGAGEFGKYSIPLNNPFADGVNGAPEIFSYGVRSPWQGSFDRVMGDFFFGDVGAFRDTSQPIWTSGDEEVNFIRNDSPGGQNFGWRVMEGDFCAPASGQQAGDLPCGHPSFVAPAYVYDYGGNYGVGGAQPFQGRSVTGGFVYRGPIEELQGMYIFGDWSSHQVWGVRIDRDANGGLGGVVPGSLVNLSTAFNRLTANNTPVTEGVTAFGEDEAGNLYFIELGGELYKITGPIIGTAAGDYNHDGTVDAADYVTWQDSLGQEVPFYTGADGNGSGVVDDADFELWRARFGTSLPSGAASGNASQTPEPGCLALLLAGSGALYHGAARSARRRRATSR